MKADLNLNQSDKSTEYAVTRIQNSLNKLQSVINNNSKITNNKNTVNRKKNRNIRKKIIDLKNNDFNRDNILFTQYSVQQPPLIGYSMFNNNSEIKTDKRKPKQEYLINNNNYQNLINSTANYVPQSTQSRNYDYNKGNYYPNYNNNYSSALKWKCLICGNINLLYNKFCINCGKAKTSQIRNTKSYNTNYFPSLNNIEDINNSYEKRNHIYNINNSNIITEPNKRDNIKASNINQNQIKQDNMNKIFKNNENNNKLNHASSELSNNINDFNDLVSSENNIISNKNNIENSNFTDISDNKTFNLTNPFNELDKNQNNINYKKLNDLYLYGDYLENELKESNDENVKLLEKYKNIKNEVHNLKNIKI